MICTDNIIRRGTLPTRETYRGSIEIVPANIPCALYYRTLLMDLADVCPAVREFATPRQLKKLLYVAQHLPGERFEQFLRWEDGDESSAGCFLAIERSGRWEYGFRGTGEHGVVEQVVLDWSQNCGLVVMDPFPLQYLADRSEPSKNQMYAGLKGTMNQSQAKLRNYFKLVNFRQVGRTVYFARSPKEEQGTGGNAQAFPNLVRVPVSAFALEFNASPNN